MRDDAIVFNAKFTDSVKSVLNPTLPSLQGSFSFTLKTNTTFSSVHLTRESEIKFLELFGREREKDLRAERP